MDRRTINALFELSEQSLGLLDHLSEEEWVDFIGIVKTSDSMIDEIDRMKTGRPGSPSYDQIEARMEKLAERAREVSDRFRHVLPASKFYTASGIHRGCLSHAIELLDSLYEPNRRNRYLVGNLDYFRQ